MMPWIVTTPAMATARRSSSSGRYLLRPGCMAAHPPIPSIRLKGTGLLPGRAVEPAEDGPAGRIDVVLVQNGVHSCLPPHLHVRRHVVDVGDPLRRQAEHVDDPSD